MAKPPVATALVACDDLELVNPQCCQAAKSVVSTLLARCSIFKCCPDHHRPWSASQGAGAGAAACMGIGCLHICNTKAIFACRAQYKELLPAFSMTNYTHISNVNMLANTTRHIDSSPQSEVGHQP